MCVCVYIYIYTHYIYSHAYVYIQVLKFTLCHLKDFILGPTMICKLIKYISFSYKDTCLKISFKTLKLKREPFFFFFLNENVLVFSSYRFYKVMV